MVRRALVAVVAVFAMVLGVAGSAIADEVPVTLTRSWSGTVYLVKADGSTRPATAGEVSVGIEWPNDAAGSSWQYPEVSNPVDSEGRFVVREEYGQGDGPTPSMLVFQYNGTDGYVTYTTGDPSRGVDQPGLWTEAGDIVRDVTIGAGGTIDVALQSPSGVSLPNTWIQVDQVDSEGNTLQYWDQSSSSSGHVILRGLPDGDYQFEIKPGYAYIPWYLTSTFDPRDSSLRATAHIRNGKQTAPLSVTLYKASSISVAVTCAECGAGDRLGAEIEWYDTVGKSWSPIDPEFHAGANNDYQYVNLRAGMYRLSLHYSGTRGYDSVIGKVVQLGDGVDDHESIVLTQSAVDGSGVSADTAAFITALYVDFLGRKPSPSDVSFWGERLGAGLPRGEISLSFVNSDEYRLIRIDAAYRSILRREPEQAGRMSWLNGMRAGLLTPDDVAFSFYSSDEYYLKCGGTKPGITVNLYHDVLGRQPSGGEVSWWALNYSRSEIVSGIVLSIEQSEVRVAAMYSLYLGRTPDRAGQLAWAAMARANGDAAVRASITGSDEYFQRAVSRFR